MDNLRNPMSMESSYFIHALSQRVENEVKERSYMESYFAVYARSRNLLGGFGVGAAAAAMTPRNHGLSGVLKIIRVK